MDMDYKKSVYGFFWWNEIPIETLIEATCKHNIRHIYKTTILYKGFYGNFVKRLSLLALFKAPNQAVSWVDHDGTSNSVSVEDVTEI